MASPEVPWRVGVEVELVAPPGRSRRDLAEARAAACDGTVRRVFHRQGEPSKVPGTPLFENLTLGFDVHDATGGLVARCVDDITLQDDLDRLRPPLPGWYRIVSDEPRLLRLVARHADPAEPLERVLDPVAALFGVAVQTGEGGMVRVADEAGAPVALGAPLPGERERGCELITPPLDADHGVRLEALLAPARALGFFVPAEGATHLHFDAARLEDAQAIVNLVAAWRAHGPALKARFGTNPRCRRLGEWPVALVERVTHPRFAELPWAEAQRELQGVGLTKYCDLNLRNFVHPTPGKHTVEVRTLPVWLHPEPIVEAAGLFARLLQWACAGGVQPVPRSVEAWA